MATPCKDNFEKQLQPPHLELLHERHTPAWRLEKPCLPPSQVLRINSPLERRGQLLDILDVHDPAVCRVVQLSLIMIDNDH
jgi:hypothetical protein